jgi:hypothetical protein
MTKPVQEKDPVPVFCGVVCRKLNLFAEKIGLFAESGCLFAEKISRTEIYL